MSELHNRVVSLDAVWGRFASEFRDRLGAARTAQAGLALFERLLIARLDEKSHEQKLVDYCIAEIRRQQGMLSIRTLSDHVGISQNHLRTQLKCVVGTSAKELARLYRFERVLRSIDPTHAVNWAQIALECGYYDQSHFNREFVAFTGHSPGRYLQLRSRIYHQDRLVYQASPRSLPID